MDNNVEIVDSPNFVVVINHEMGGVAAGFDVNVSNTGFTILIASGGGSGGSMTDSEVKTAYENNADTNAFDDAEQSKLAALETLATADQTGAEIKALYEGEADTNAFDDAAVSKLSAIEANAKDDQTDAEIRTAVEAASNSNVFTDADHTKLNAVESGATADQTNAEIRAAVAAATDSNVFQDSDVTKIDAIEALADVTDASNVASAGAVMDSDISEGEGFLRKTGSGAYEAIKTNLGAATNPGASNDNTGGYAVGSRWINTTADKEYVCLDATTAAAVWTETTGAGGGGMSDAEVKTAYENNANTNEFDDAEQTKLAGIETGATTDQSNAEIRTAVGAATDSNVYDDAAVTKLGNIENAADVTDTDNVASAGAIMDGDISAGEGFIRKTGSGAYTAVKTNLGAVTNPGTGDDNTGGYAIGSRWINVTLDKEFVCLDITTAAAVWTETTGGGGGMSDSEVKTAYENNANTNEFDDAEQSKLAGIEANATIDQTNAEIRAAVEAATDSNAFTDADHSKLDAIEANATADQTNAEIEAAYAIINAQVSGGEITAGTEATLRTYAPDDIKAFVDQHSGPINVQRPTRTTVTLSGSSNVIAIPDGVTWFKFRSGLITTSNTGGSPNATLQHGSNVDQPFTGLEEQMNNTTTLNLNTLTANEFFTAAGAEGGGFSRYMSGIVVSPRDDTKATIAEGYGMAVGFPYKRWRHVIADTAKDNYQITFAIGVGTMTGTIEIEWFYDGGPVKSGINTQVGTSYTLVLDDSEDIVEGNNASANVITIPADATTNFAIGTIITITAIGAGITSITAAAGVSINGITAGSGELDGQYAGVTIYKRGIDEWIVQGAIGVIS